MPTYHYIGPIKRFGKIVAREWEGETTAPSLPKGVNNLKFKAKKYLGLSGNAQVELIRENIEEIDDLDMIETEEYNRSYDPDYDIPDDWEGSYEDGNLKLRDVEPRKGESKQNFISRFMRETKSEYPDYKQRLAVAYSYWNKR